MGANLALTQNPSSDAIALLATHGIAAERRPPWVHIGRTAKREGWKIHLSCVPTALSALVACLAERHHHGAFAFKTVMDMTTAEILNEGGFGATQVGKCATIYPEDAAQFRDLVDCFSRIKNIEGPRVPDDVRLGPIVYARWGGFNPDMTRDLLGQAHQMIAAPDGKLVRDGYDRKTTKSRYDEAFGQVLPAWPYPPILQAGSLLGERYLIIGTLKESPKGFLIQAIDRMEHDQVRALIIKQGRAHVLSDRLGRDIRTRLKAQMKWHAIAAPLGIAPHCDPYFECGGDGYLPIVFQSGDNFELWIQETLLGRTFDVAPKPVQRTILQSLASLSRQLEKLHHCGIVHRDLSPSNILLNSTGNPLLSDLEIAAWIGDTAPFGKGTPGFMAPEQERGAPADPRADIRALAAVVLYAVTGLDPRRLPASCSGSLTPLRGLAQSLGEPFWDMLERALAPDPAKRPPLGDVIHLLADGEDAEWRAPLVVPQATSLPMIALRGLSSLSSPALFAGPVWFSAPVGPGQSDSNHLELRRSLNRGVAGPLYLCARHSDLVRKDSELLLIVRNAARYLLDDRSSPDYAMPGLHFGEAGVLLALLSARQAGLVVFADSEVAHLWPLAFHADIAWPDLTHGAAGRALSLVQLKTLVPSLAHDADAIIAGFLRHLRETQKSDGAWILPPGIDGISGEIVTGIAHGVAGMAYALALCGGEEDLIAAERAGTWLLAVAERRGQSLSWRYSDQNPAHWMWWCHGAPGISALFAALYSKTGKAMWRDTTLACFGAIDEGLNSANLSLCHGMAGLGELMLDAARIVQAPELRERALGLAAAIVARRGFGERDVFWIVENTSLASADLMVGMGGVVDFLLRLVDSTQNQLLFPGHLDPTGGVAISLA